MSLGEIIGKAEPLEYSFQLNGAEDVRKGDFVVAQHALQGLVLCRVRNVIKQAEKHPDSAGEKIINTVASVSVIGSKDSRGLLKPPKTAFSPGDLVWKADAQFIAHTLGLSGDEEKGLYLGCVDGYSSLKVLLDPEKLLTKHLAVLAVSGSGKSYCVGVILEEMLEKKFAVVVIDPHGEYASLRDANDDEREKALMSRFGIEPHGFAAVKEYGVGTGVNRLLLSDRALKSRELADMLGTKLNNAQLGCLYEAIRIARKDNPEYSLADISGALEKQDGSIKWPVLSAIEELTESGILSQNPTPLEELVVPGQATIVNLKGANALTQQIIVTRLLDDLFAARKFNRVPPFFLVVEEAHTFTPERSFGEVASSAVMRTIASEGRKFGLGLCVVTQRPARIDKNVLSQCNTQIVLRMRNPNDLKAIGASMERFDSLMEEELKSLPVGTSIVSGEAVEVNLVVEVRPRKTKHGGKAALSAAQQPVVVTPSSLRERKAKLLLDRSEVEKTGLKIHALLWHPFWVLSAPSGDLLLDAVYAKFCEQKLNEIVTYKPFADLKALDSNELLVLSKIFQKGEVYSSETSTLAKEVGLDRKIVDGALDELTDKAWLAKHDLGNLKAFTPAPKMQRLRVIDAEGDEAKAETIPRSKFAVSPEQVAETMELLRSFTGVQLVHLPIYIAMDSEGKARVIRAYA